MRALIVLGIVSALALGVAAPVMADSGPNSPTVTKGVGSPLGAERAGRNSNGGDRENGGFGPAQSAYVNSLNAQGIEYGQWLKEWCAAAGSDQGCSAK